MVPILRVCDLPIRGCLDHTVVPSTGVSTRHNRGISLVANKSSRYRRQHVGNCLKCMGQRGRHASEDGRQEAGFLGSVLLPAFSVTWDGGLSRNDLDLMTSHGLSSLSLLNSVSHSVVSLGEQRKTQALLASLGMGKTSLWPNCIPNGVNEPVVPFLGQSQRFLLPTPWVSQTITWQ